MPALQQNSQRLGCAWETVAGNCSAMLRRRVQTEYFSALAGQLWIVSVERCHAGVPASERAEKRLREKEGQRRKSRRVKKIRRVCIGTGIHGIQICLQLVTRTSPA